MAVKPKALAKTSIDAVRDALRREEARRGDYFKPIEIVKFAIHSYQSRAFISEAPSLCPAVESEDRMGLRRGTQASIDRLLFNINYWRAAYEDRIVAACSNADDAQRCLKAVSTWNSHTMKLNTLLPEEVTSVFERFCPPPASNNRRGARAKGSGKGPVHDFTICALEVVEHETLERAQQLRGIVADMKAEAQTYAGYADAIPLDALYELLPAWCLQETIELVTGSWWDDVNLMSFIGDELYKRFCKLGFSESYCDYFRDSFGEALDSYIRDISADESPFFGQPVPKLVSTIRDERSLHPRWEADGYGPDLPAWLLGKEQLIWNTIVCAIYGPMYTRPLLADNVSNLPVDGKPANKDAITEMAERAYADYLATRRSSGVAPEYGAFDVQPEDLRNSGLERIESIPVKLDLLGYRIVPAGSCYPEQRVFALTPSEVECLAILEHRRWVTERTKAGWEYSPVKNVTAKQSPYLVTWEELPERVREWNRSTIRDIPTLLATVGLAIAR